MSFVSLKPLPPFIAPEYGRGFPADRLQKAVLTLEPGLGMLFKQGTEEGGVVATDVEWMRSRYNAATVRLRCVIAALNGVDVDKKVVETHDPVGAPSAAPVMLPRDLLARMKKALLNEAVYESLVKVVGEDEADDLLGQVAGL